MEQDPFKEYIKETEPEKRDKGYAWHTAIGLQAVDGLRPSKYLIDTAIKNIEGDISIDEAGELLNSYYEETGTWTAAMNVSERIFMNKIFASYIPSFTYRLVNVHQYTNEQLLIHEDEGIHRRSDGLFDKDDRRQSDGKLV